MTQRGPGFLESLQFFGLAILACGSAALAADTIKIDASGTIGEIRPLHGVNNGPLNQGETVDVSSRWKDLAVPSTRLHDSEWPAGDLVDMHAIFPDLNADPQSPASYRFQRTDDYLAPIVASGSGIVYRLGESIEHSRKRFYTHPPRDYDRWAQACLGIIGHYNDGWADGKKYQIRHWEIWNEPENRPAMWSGTDDDYYRLYLTAAKAIKSRYPDLKVGGPAVGATGEIVDGAYQPTAFLQGFLNACRTSGASLDFFSWHTYTDDPDLYARKAVGIRRWLDQEGFRDTELHLNEWNYLPGNDWGPMLNTSDPSARDRWYAEMAGMPGANFVVRALIGFQDSPLDVANYYSGDTSPFGLFGRFGTPKKTYYGFLAFRKLLATPQRLQADGSAQATVLAGMNRSQTSVQVLISQHRPASEPCALTFENLPWSGPSDLEILQLDETRNLERIVADEINFTSNSLTRLLLESGVLLVKLSKR